MPGRRRAREFAVQALYAADQGSVGSEPALQGVWSVALEAGGEPASEEEVDFTTRAVRGVLGKLTDLDERIEKASVNWRLSRMPVVDRNILRLGAWELIYCKDVPVSVSINEAIELAKLYGGVESRAFVNGILDRIAAEIGRGGRRVR